MGMGTRSAVQAPQVSPVATRVYRYLRNRPDGGEVTIEEIVENTRSSKTSVRAAMNELQLDGHLTYEQQS